MRVPVRVRLELTEERAGHPGLPGLVGSAVAAAAGRAMDRARGVQAVGRSAAGPGDVPCRLSVRFAGDALPGPAAAELEASIRTALCDAAAGLRARPGLEVVTVAPGSGEERDETRVISYLDHLDKDVYLVPGYDRHGRPVAVQLRDQRPAVVPQTRVGLRMRYFPTEDALARAVVDHFGGNPPPRLIAVSADTPDTSGHGTSAITLMEFRGQAGWIVGAWKVFIRLPPAGNRPGQVAGVIIHDVDGWRFRGAAADRAGRVRLIAAFTLQWLSRQPAHDRVTADELQKQAEMIAQYGADPKEGPGRIFALVSGTTEVWHVEMTGTYPPEEDLPAAVFTERADLPLPPAYGSDCPPLQQAPDWLAGFGLTNPNLRITHTAFLFEPPISSFPIEVAADLRAQVSLVADQLNFQSGAGEFVGGFLISAMNEIDRRCRIMAKSGRAIGDQLVEIAAAFGTIRDLAEFYTDALVARDGARALYCPLAGQAETWRLRFYEVYLNARDAAVGSMFVSACQSRLLAVLQRSKNEIDRRLNNLVAYVALTRVLLLSLLADTPRLTELQGRLKAAEFARRYGIISAGPEGWAQGGGELVAALEELTRPAAPEPGTVRFRDGAYRILDDTGRWWSAAELDLVLSTAREQALRVDPFLDKLSELPDLVAKLQEARCRDEQAADAGGTRTFEALKEELLSQFRSLLDDNREYTNKAWRDRSVAFGLATFKEREGEEEIAARMSGIYKVADEFLRPAFTDQDAYAAGVDRLADEEIERESAKQFFELIGMTVLAVFFPEIAFVIGAAQAVESIDQALEHRRLQHAMIGGDEILSKAQVEAELWSAAIGAALVVLPEIPAAARGAGALVRGEAGEAAAVALRRTLTRITAQLAEASLAHFAKEFTKELVKMYLINLALSRAIGGIAQAVADQVQRTGDASLADLPDFVAQAISGSRGGTP